MISNLSNRQRFNMIQDTVDDCDRIIGRLKKMDIQVPEALHDLIDSLEEESYHTAMAIQADDQIGTPGR